MAGGLYRVSWVTPAGAVHCEGCDRGDIQPGRRALRFLGGPGRLKILTGTWFHGWACLASSAQRRTFEEESRSGPGAGEIFRDLEQWARQQDRAARYTP